MYLPYAIKKKKRGGGVTSLADKHFSDWCLSTGQSETHTVTGTRSLSVKTSWCSCCRHKAAPSNLAHCSHIKMCSTRQCYVQCCAKLLSRNGTGR